MKSKSYLHITFALQLQCEIHQETWSKAIGKQIMVLLYRCGNVFEEAGQCCDEVCVILRLPCRRQAPA